MFQPVLCFLHNKIFFFYYRGYSISIESELNEEEIYNTRVIDHSVLILINWWEELLTELLGDASSCATMLCLEPVSGVPGTELGRL